MFCSPTLVLPEPCSGGCTLCLPFTPALLCLSQPALSPIALFQRLQIAGPAQLTLVSEKCLLAVYKRKKWKVEYHLMSNVVECLCYISLRGLRLHLPEKADKSYCHPVIPLPSLQWLWPCSMWTTHSIQEHFLFFASVFTGHLSSQIPNRS